jgi:hypothetical protein
VDVGFGAHNGLKWNIPEGPFCAQKPTSGKLLVRQFCA